MRKAKAAIDAMLGAVLAGLMGFAVLNVVWQVFSRFVLRNPSSYTEELARYLLIWIGLIGAAYAVGQGMHLAIDLLPAASGPRNRRRLQVLAAICVLIFAVTILIWGGSRLVWMTLYLNQSSAAMGVKLGYVYLALPISGVMMSFYAITQLMGIDAAPAEPAAPAAASATAE